MFIEGFIFGMLLQLSIGPVCLYILNTAVSKGLTISLISVIGVTLADAVYIALALTGISGFINNRKFHTYFKLLGGAILVLFGAYIIIGVFAPNYTFRIPGTAGIKNDAGYFLTAFILTISNPLTIVFWAGIFASKLGEKTRAKNGIYWFALGAVLSTAFFLSLIALLGTFINFYFPQIIIKILNLSAGVFIIIFGIFLLAKKTTPKEFGFFQPLNKETK